MAYFIDAATSVASADHTSAKKCPVTVITLDTSRNQALLHLPLHRPLPTMGDIPILLKFAVRYQYNHSQVTVYNRTTPTQQSWVMIEGAFSAVTSGQFGLSSYEITQSLWTRKTMLTC